MSEERRGVLEKAYLKYGVSTPFSASSIGADSGAILQMRAKGYIHGRSGSWRVSSSGVKYLKKYVMR